MASIQESFGDYKAYSINDFTGGMATNPGKPNQHFMIYNMMVRTTDGYLVPRGTVYELLLSAPYATNSSTPIDIIVNNVGGPASGGGETPYHFFVQNASSAGQLGLFKVNHTGASQTISFVDHTLNTSLTTPVIPSYAWGVDANGSPHFLFSVWNGSGDDTLYEFDGTTLSALAAPPGSQMLLGFFDNAAFAGGGSINGAITLRNIIYWSTPASLTSWPSSNFTTAYTEKGIALQDMVVSSARQLITSNVSFLSLTGDPTNGFLPIEMGRVDDLLLKNTLSLAGSIPLVAGLNGLYSAENNILDISLPVKGIYDPVHSGFGIGNIGIKTGYGSFSSGGYFYGINNQTPGAGTLISKMPIAHTTNESSIVLVYDTKFKIWVYFGYEFTLAGMCPMDANALNVSTSANTFLTGFAFTGKSPAGKNALYFSESSNTTGSDTVDGASVNYKTGLVTGPIDFGVSNGLKHIGGITVVGVTSNSTKIIIQTLENNNEWKTIEEIDNYYFNEEIQLDILTDKIIRIAIQGDSTTEIGKINLKYAIKVPELVH